MSETFCTLRSLISGNIFLNTHINVAEYFFLKADETLNVIVVSLHSVTHKFIMPLNRPTTIKLPFLINI